MTPPLGMQLRACAPADFETLYAIDQACYPRGIAYSRRELRSYLAQPGADCLVAEIARPEPVIAGFIVTDAEPPEGHIVTIDVSEPYRRMRVGTVLLEAIEQRLAARGVNRIALETATSNEAAVAFWKRHGYRSAGVLRGYYLGRLDAYWMVKRIG